MLSSNYITKIEGHGKLKIDFEKNKAKLIVDEGERLFEGLVLERKFYDIPFIVSRICGVCPTAHYLASVKALENVFGILPSGQSVNLRKIILLGQIAQSHILHTVFLALPDYIGCDSIADIAKKAPAEFASALEVKKISDKVVEIIGGRPVHPVTPTIGGFAKYPSKKSLEELRDNLQDSLSHVYHLTDFFQKLEYPKLVRETKYLALDNDREYAFYDGRVTYNFGYSFEPDLYKKEISEYLPGNSTAKYAKHHDNEFMVGALARISLHPHKLRLNAKNKLEKYFERHNFPSYNPYHNNLAQMIEIMHAWEEMILLLNQVIKSGLGQSKVDFKVKAGKGVGAIEAPRGTLYHYYEIDKNGTIVDCDIVTPTVQNLFNLEKDAEKLMTTTKSLSNKKRAKLAEMLIRAYDPCITCSVH